MFKKMLVCLLFIAVFNTVAYAGTADEPKSAVPKVYVLDNYSSLNETEDGLLFLFSNAKITQTANGDLFVVGGKTIISGTVKGNIYAFFADVTVEKTGSAQEIGTFLSKIKFGGGAEKEMSKEPASMLFGFPERGYLQEGYLVYDTTLPDYLLKTIVSLLQAFICIIIFYIKRGFMEQGGVLLVNEPIEVLKNGITGYFVAFALALIFALTVVFLPVSILIVIVAFILMLIGQVSFSITIGFMLASYLKKEYNSFIYLLAGLAITEVMKNIPYLSVGFTMVFLPIITFGIVMTCLINGFIKKKFYDLPYEGGIEEKRFDNSQIRDIILKDSL